MKTLYRGIFIATFKRTYIQDQAWPIIVTSLLSYETSPYFSWRENSLLPKFFFFFFFFWGERGGSVVECRTPEREVRGSRPTVAVLCPWARHFTPRKYWLITQEAMAPSRYDWKIVDWDVKPQHNLNFWGSLNPEADLHLCCSHMA